MPKNLLRDNTPFYITCSVLFVLLGILVVVFPKPGCFILLNTFHASGLDFIFRYLTFLGDGIFILLLTGVFFLIKKRIMAAHILASFLFSGIFVQVLKHIFGLSRPVLYFRLHHITYNHFLTDISLHGSNSFPSGHTTSAFALAATLAFLLKNKKYGILLAISAFLVGCSRIYLGQHFPEDIEAGMVLGVLCSTVSMAVFGTKFFRQQDLVVKKK